MIECPECRKPLEPPTVKCMGCGIELHRSCARKTSGRWYCGSCFKRGKREARLERMAQRASMASGKPGKLW